MNIRMLLLPFALILSTGVAIADAEVGAAPLPEWVDRLDLESFSEDRSAEHQGGVAYLLLDRQVSKTDIGFDYAQRFAYEVLDRSGLERAATITSVFDPSSDTLDFNFIRVIRNGEATDRLADAEITVLRQEEGLDSSLLDGSMTALVQLEDIRVGDIVDYSISGAVDSKLWPEHLFEWTQVEWSVPIARIHFKLRAPEDLAVNAQSISTDIEAEIEKTDGWTTYTIDLQDPDPIPAEQFVPTDWVHYGFVAFTTMDAWADVADWAVPLYDIDGPLPAEFVTRLDAIATAHSDPEDRAIHTLRLVQEEVRYLGIEIALGSHVPRAPDVTLERGYGDCKDKSVLLVAALEHLGISAVPALASLSFGDALPQFPPSISGFDHVIVGIDIGDRKLWVDPTLSHQGGLADNITPLGYGHVLPIRSGQTTLVELPLPLTGAPIYEVRETFTVPSSGDVGMVITAEYIHRSVSADSTRLRLISQGQEGLTRDLLDYYTDNYQGIVTSDALVVTDDLDANVITYKVVYEMDAETFAESDYRSDLPVFATAVRGVLPGRVEAQRTAPLGLPYGSDYRHVIRIETPGRRFRLPDSDSRQIGGISYSREFRDDDGAFVLDYRLVVADERAGLDEARDVTDLADEVSKGTELTIKLSAAQPTLARRIGLDRELDPETESAITRANEQIDDEEYVAALTSLNALVREHTEADELRGYLQLQRAKVLMELGRRKAALAPFEEALGLYEPPGPDAYFKYLNALRREDSDSALIPVISLMLERHPEAVERFNMNWVGGLYRDLRDADLQPDADALSLAIAYAAHDADVDDINKFGWHFLNAIEILAREKKAEEASGLIQHLRHPDAFAQLLAKKSNQAIWDSVEAAAGKDLTTAINNYIDHTRLAAEDTPDDYRAIMRHVGALRAAGQYDEAMRFADGFLDDWARIEAVGEDAYWFINEVVHVLFETGQTADSFELMERLLDLGVAENGALISMAINRASLLTHSGQFEAALAAVKALEDLGEDYASDYGWMWIYAAKACSLHQLGRVEEAQTVLLDSMRPLSEKNRDAIARAFVCLDQYDDAAAVIIEQLEDTASNGDIIVSFSSSTRPSKRPPFLAELYRRHAEVRRRPDVQAAFNKVGRALEINGASAYWGTN